MLFFYLQFQTQFLYQSEYDVYEKYNKNTLNNFTQVNNNVKIKGCLKKNTVGIKEFCMLPEELKNEIKEFEPAKQEAIMSYQKDGRYLVIAGPGTGKTFTITKRIQAILSDEENGTNADKILCLTFSDAAANEMVLALEKNNVKNAQDINIFTFHSFCMHLMEDYPDLFHMEQKSLITVTQKQAIVKECLDELSDGNPEIEINEEDKYSLEAIRLQSIKDGIVQLRTDNNLYGKILDIVQGIEAIKHNRLTADKIIENLKNNIEWLPKFKELNKEEEKETHKGKIAEIFELLRIYEKYKEKSQEYIDFDDMINNVLDAFENNETFLQNVASNYDFIMVDEYQDTNKSQNDIVFSLGNKCKNILVVGDDDQIIYAFQGASLDTIDNFTKKLGNVDVFTFKENRRSTPTILKVAEELAKLQDRYHIRFEEKYDLPKYLKEGLSKTEVTNLKKEMKAKIIPLKFRYTEKELKSKNDKIKQKDKPVLIKEFSDAKTELTYIINEIKSIINNQDLCPKDKDGNKKLSEIAILTKTNSEAYAYANKLKESGIRSQLVGGKNIFETNSVKVLVSYLQFLSNPQQNPDKLYKYLLYKPFHIHPKDFQLLNSKEIKDISGSSLIRRMKEAITQSENEEKKQNKDERKILADKKKFEDFIASYEKIEDYIAGESVQNSVIKIASLLGITTCYLSIIVNRTENQDALDRFYAEAAIYDETHPQSTLKEFTRYITMLLNSGIEIRTDKSDKPYNAVQISTLHSSKGREFEYVFMPSVTNTKYEGNSQNDNKEIVPVEQTEIASPIKEMGILEKIEDKGKQEKFRNSAKLIYVGMTRAKHYLFMSYPTASKAKPSWFIEKMLYNIKNSGNKSLIDDTPLTISDNKDFEKDENIEKRLNGAIKYLRNLENIIPEEEKESYNNELSKIDEIAKVLEFTAAPDEAIMPDYDYQEEFQDYINTHIPNHYSVSSVNQYLDCPKSFLYQHVLHLGPEEELEEDTPEEDTGSEYYAEWGTTIHYALENYVKEVIQTKKHFGFEVMEKYFDEKQKELIRDAERNTITKKKDNLKKYFAELIQIPPERFFAVERKVPDSETEGGKKYLPIEGINFKGTVDRIDVEEINGEKVYSIFDYKTGTKKSGVKDKVCSKRASEDKPKHRIYNQLAFYKYVLEKEYNMKIKDVGIIFPEEPESSFIVDELSGEEGLKNCELVAEKFITTVKEDISQNHTFNCKEGCAKAGKFCFCNYKDFCKSEVI